MSSPKLTLQTLVTFFVLFFFLSASHAKQDVQFSWAVLSDMATGQQALDFSQVPRLNTGETLQIYLEPKNDTYIYLYFVESTGGVYLLFPPDPNHYNSQDPVKEAFYLPSEEGRFELASPAGQEKIYLLASPSRLTTLETLTAAYLKNTNDKNRRAAVLKELKLLRRKHSSLAQKTETSVPVAGTVRSRGLNTGSFDAIQVNAKGFYSKILRITHD